MLVVVGTRTQLKLRAHVERQFSAERMVDDYLRLYRRLLDHDRERDLNDLPHHRRASTAEPAELSERKPREHDATRVTRASRTCSAVEMASLRSGSPCARGVDLATTAAAEAIAAGAAALLSANAAH
jgi:hypothetical protein